MLLTQDTDEGFYKVKAYSQGSVTVNEGTYTSPFILSPEKIIFPWHIDLKSLSAACFSFLDDLQPAVFLFGTGEKAIFPHVAILKIFTEKHIGIECMTTAAACRTYNVLASERRNVVAGLIP